MSPGFCTKIVNLIKKSKKKSLSINEIYKLVKDKYPRVTKNQIKRTLREVIKIDAQRTKEGKPERYFISANKGGNAFRFTGGGETTRKNTGPYRDIAKVIDGDTKTITRIFGAPHLNSFDVHAGKSGRGKWGRPDVIVALYRGIGSSRPYNLHAVEYEGKGKFSPANVAQAYFGGNGADKCWLLFDSRDWPKNANDRRSNPSAERVKDFAEELGVGLIYYRKLAHSGGWFKLLDAKKQKRNKDARAELKHLFQGEERKLRKAQKIKRVRRKRLNYY
jgi:hypothetical protein